MSMVEHYRAEAARCRRLVAEQPHSKHVQRWLVLAQNYDLMAEVVQKETGARLQQVVANAKTARNA